MTPELDLETLRILVAVEETGSIGAAARAVGVSQPAASARIREFEARWRLALVTRTHRGSGLTTDGKLVVSWSRSVLGEVDVMRSGLASLAAEPSGLAVAASLTIAEFILPRWVGKLRERYPDLRPRLIVVNSDAVVTTVRAGDVDVGFIESTAIPSDLTSRHVGQDRLSIVVRPDHPWADRSTPVTRDELAETEFVLRESGSGTRHTFDTAMGEAPRVALEAGSTTAQLSAVQAGLGPAVVSRRAVARQLEYGSLVEVSHQLELERPLTALWSSHRRLTGAADALVAIASATTAPLSSADTPHS